jgi:hypothetical protein
LIDRSTGASGAGTASDAERTSMTCGILSLVCALLSLVVGPLGLPTLIAAVVASSARMPAATCR